MLKVQPAAMVLLGWILWAIPLWSVNPQFWNTESYSEFAKGKLSNLSLSREGHLSLAPQFKSLFNADQALIWGAAYDSKNGDLFVGTGHDGKVFKVDRKGESSLFFDASELDVLALALDSERNLYAATSPDGKIYKIDSKGKASVFFDPEDKFIWDLRWDSRGTLYVATGSKGRIYKVNKEGKGELLFESGQTNLMCLEIDAEGNVLAGSEPDGYLYRISPQGKAFVLYDSSMREIHQVAVDPSGNIYFIGISSPAVTSAGMTRPPVESAPTPFTLTGPLGTERKMDEGTPLPSPTTIPQPMRLDTAPLKSAIYRINRDQLVETLWSAENETAFALLVEKDGQLLFSTGQKGKIYRLEIRKKPVLLMETAEEQTTRLISGSGEVYACTSNLARVYRMTPAFSEEGSYESDVKDTQSTPTWGDIQWRSELPEKTSLQLFTRSGNTQKPDKTWSDWSTAYTRSEGEKIKSPPARYIQYKAALKGNKDKSPQLTMVSLPFLPRNFPPEIKYISVLPPGVALQASAGGGSRSAQSGVDQASAEASGAKSLVNPGGSVSIPPRRVFQKGAQSIQWESEDRNGDDLIYTVYLKGEKEETWRLLREEVEERFVTLESDSLPDGKYQIRVQVSDSPSNPRAKALSGEMVSPVFEIDNTPPQVQVTGQDGKASAVCVIFKASDTGSGLRKAEVSLDGKDWEPVYPIDGVLDSKTEEFEFRRESLPSGEHTVTLRVYDSSGNVGLGKSLVVVKP